MCFVAFSSVVFGTTGTGLELVTGLPKKVGGGTASAFLTSNSPSATASSVNAGNCIYIGNNATELNGHIGLAGTTKFWGWLIYPWGE